MCHIEKIEKLIRLKVVLTWLYIHKEPQSVRERGRPPITRRRTIQRKKLENEPADNRRNMLGRTCGRSFVPYAPTRHAKLCLYFLNKLLSVSDLNKLVEFHVFLHIQYIGLSDKMSS